MPKQTFTCSGCGAEVKKYTSQLTRTDIVFCTLLCRNKHYKQVVPEWHPPNYKEYNHICRVCGCEFTTNGSSFKANTRTVCGAVCRGRIARKGAVLSDSTKAKLSEAAVRQNKKYKSDIKYIRKDGLQIFMKSKWEASYARWLDASDIAWRYEPEFKLSNGKIYLPDFLLEDGSVVEIKGYFRPDAKVKWDMFCEEYPNIKKSLLQKNELKELGII